MSNDTESATRIVADAIQRTYNDASQTVLDHAAAIEILRVLREAGWASLDDVARLIESAGGEIVVPGSVLADGLERRVTRQDDFASGGVKFRTSVSA